MAMGDFSTYGLSGGKYFFPQDKPVFNRPALLNQVERAEQELREVVDLSPRYGSDAGTDLGPSPGVNNNFAGPGVGYGLAGAVGSLVNAAVPGLGTLLSGAIGAGIGGSTAQVANAALDKAGVATDWGYDVGKASLSGAGRSVGGLLGSLAGVGSYTRGIEEALAEDMGPKGTGTTGLTQIADQLGNLGRTNTLDALGEKMGISQPQERGDYAYSQPENRGPDTAAIAEMAAAAGEQHGGFGPGAQGDPAGHSANSGEGFMARGGPVRRFAQGGGLLPERAVKGPGGGMDDLIPASIDGREQAALSNDEFVIPADVVSLLGDGSSNAGHKKLYDLVSVIRKMKYGHEEQPKKLGLSPRGLANIIGG